MSSRVVTALAGIVFLGLGIAGLRDPVWVMNLVGYPTAGATPAVFGEVRAVYGGLFAVMGVFTLFAAGNPARHRGALLLIGLLWLGIFAGRGLGAYLDGDPGLQGWIAAAIEVVFGVTMVLVAALARPRVVEPAAHAEPTFPLAGPTEL
jgi:hypothetical protein